MTISELNQEIALMVAAVDAVLKTLRYGQVSELSNKIDALDKAVDELRAFAEEVDLNFF